MKYYILLFSLMLSTLFSFGQEVEIKNDTVYADGKAVFLYKKGYNHDKSIRSLSNQELLYLQKIYDGTSFIGSDLIFMDTGEKVFFKPNLYIDKEVTTKLVLDNVIQGDSINPEGKRRFMIKFGNQNKSITQSSEQPNSEDVVDELLKGMEGLISAGGVSGTNYKLVERKRSSPIYVFGSEIKQDFKVIGTCKSSTQNIDNKFKKVVSFYLPNQTKVAEAIYDPGMDKSCTITTLKNNRTHSFQIQNKARAKEEIAEFLVGKYYL